MLTCDRCLAGQPSRCRRGDCAQWVLTGRSERTRRTRPAQWVPTGRPIGRPRTTTSVQDHEVAHLLVVGSTMTAVAEHLGISRPAVIRVRNELRVLDELGVSLGPSDAVSLTFNKRGAGRNGRGLHGLRGGASREAAHKAALLLCEGRTLRESADLAGISFHQARTVKSNLRTLEAAALGVTRGSRRW